MTSIRGRGGSHEFEPVSKSGYLVGYSVDGHNVGDLKSLILKEQNNLNGKPKCIIANTLKGKGVSFMENKLKWHYKSPDQDDFIAACIELGEG